MPDDTEKAAAPDCSDCGQSFLLDAGYDVGQSAEVCATCANNYCKCSNCCTWLANDDARSVNGSQMCESCADEYYTCDVCEAQVHGEEISSTEQETGICTSCRDSHYSYSNTQETYIRDRDYVHLADIADGVSLNYARYNCSYHVNSDTWYADEDNVPCDDDGETGLFEYRTDVLWHCAYDRRAIRNGALVFGVELEMEAVDGSSRDIVEALGGREADQYILKEDGSLTDGAELVTVPLTLEQHRTDFGWEKVCKRARTVAQSGAGTTHCGIHVHINKAALSALQIGKMLVFLNDPDMRRNLDTIAQRASNGYCERSEKKIGDGKRRSENRYDIANVGSHTVEIRMFRGNLRHERVLKNIEFCHALVTYCGDCSIVTVADWSVFADWLLKRRGQYQELVKFLDGARVPGFVDVVKPRKDEQKEVIACA